MKFNRKIMHFHPSRPDRLLGFNQSGELWAVVGKIEFAKTRPLDGWVRLSGDNPATITDVGGNELGVIWPETTMRPLWKTGNLSPSTTTRRRGSA